MTVRDDHPSHDRRTDASCPTDVAFDTPCTGLMSTVSSSVVLHRSQLDRHSTEELRTPQPTLLRRVSTAPQIVGLQTSWPEDDSRRSSSSRTLSGDLFPPDSPVAPSALLVDDLAECPMSVCGLVDNETSERTDSIAKESPNILASVPRDNDATQCNQTPRMPLARPSGSPGFLGRRPNAAAPADSSRVKLMLKLGIYAPPNSSVCRSLAKTSNQLAADFKMPRDESRNCQLDAVPNGRFGGSLSACLSPKSAAPSSGPNTPTDVAPLNFCLSLFDLRSREDFRINYLKKLSYANVWIPKARRVPKHQTILIFDWDDTLLCTSYINLRGENISKAVAQQLAAIECHGRNLLSLAMTMGRVFVITNAMNGWVEFSASKFLPGLVKTLEGVTVISARDKYEVVYPGDYQQWKTSAFLEVQKSLNAHIITNLVSVGDSTIEMDAVHIMGQEFSLALVKTVKLRENPSPEELAKQLQLLVANLEKICQAPKNLMIALERRSIQPRQRRLSKRPNNNNDDGKND